MDYLESYLRFHLIYFMAISHWKIYYTCFIQKAFTPSTTYCFTEIGSFKLTPCSHISINNSIINILHQNHCYNWWNYIDISLSSKSHRFHWSSVWCYVFCGLDKCMGIFIHDYSTIQKIVTALKILYVLPFQSLIFSCLCISIFLPFQTYLLRFNLYIIEFSIFKCTIQWLKYV